MKLSELYKESRDRIADENNWCKQDFARNKNNLGMSPVDPRACKWCFLGTWIMTERNHDIQHFSSLETQFHMDSYSAMSATYGSSMNVIDFNDNNSHADVINVWNKMISIAEERES